MALPNTGRTLFSAVIAVTAPNTSPTPGIRYGITVKAVLASVPTILLSNPSESKKSYLFNQLPSLVRESE